MQRVPDAPVPNLDMTGDERDNLIGLLYNWGNSCAIQNDALIAWERAR
jgi:hypothetical protein